MPCLQCSGITKSGSRCSLNTCARFPYCWIHLRSIDKLQIKPSTIPNAGKGLFYVGKKNFPANKRITTYSAKEVQKSKDDVNGDYVLQVSKNQFLDGADVSNYVGRYINSAKDSGSASNVRFSASRRISKQTVNGETRFTYPIMSRRVIKPGSELLLHYGKDYNL